MMIRSIVIALATALVMTCSGPASAQQQAKCIAGKTKCMSTKAGGLLKCEATAETPGKLPDQSACTAKVVGKFDGGMDSTKGCFAKLENKKGNDCLTFGDTPAAEAAVDSCVGSFVAAIDPPPTTQTKCGAGKKKCVAKYLGALLKCAATAQTPGKVADPSCISKATAKYNGGADATKGCFAKLEAKKGNDCADPKGNSDALQTLVQDCVEELGALVTTPPTTTTTTMPAGGMLLKGALAPTPGRFNYNATLGLPGANAACNAQFPGHPRVHVCGAADRGGGGRPRRPEGHRADMTVTSFWAIDSSAPARIQQCQSTTPWAAPASTGSTGRRTPPPAVTRFALNNGTGALGPLVDERAVQHRGDELGRLLPVNDAGVAGTPRAGDADSRHLPPPSFSAASRSPASRPRDLPSPAPPCSAPGTGWCLARRIAGNLPRGELGFRFGEPLDVDGDGHADIAAGARFKLAGHLPERERRRYGRGRPAR